MPKNLLNADEITPELLREQFLWNDFTIMPDTLPKNMTVGEQNGIIRSLNSLTIIGKKSLKKWG